MLAAVEDVLVGAGYAMLPVPADDESQTRLLTTSLRAGEDIDDDVAVVVSTSGTTGTPKGAMLTAAALRASADATHRRLGGSGRWLLALPAYHIAGLQVLVRSVIAAESAFQPNARSPKGAIGPMQLMPETAKDLGVDPHDPAQNVDAGTRYLRDLLQRYDSGLWHALAAYNAGPGAVDKYRGVPPYRETRNYVNRIDRAYKQ